MPVAVTVAVLPFTRPVIFASALVRAVPSYSFSSLPVVTVTSAFSTVRVPGTFVTLVNSSVLSLPSASLIIQPSSTIFSLLPASVWVPSATASTVKPSGRPAAVTFSSPVPSAVSGVPSYVLVALGAVRVTSVSFIVTVSVPRF